MDSSKKYLEFNISYSDKNEGIVDENTMVLFQKENLNSIKLREREITLLTKMNENCHLSNSILIHGFIGTDKLKIVETHFTNYKVLFYSIEFGRLLKSLQVKYIQRFFREMVKIPQI
jgi:hypothetical protein